MLLLIMILVFIISLILIYTVLSSQQDKQITAKVQPSTLKLPPEYDLNKPLYQRLFQPIARKVGPMLEKLTPQSTLAMYEDKIMAAGGLQGITAGEFIAFWSFIALGIAVGSGVVADAIYHYPVNKIIAFVLFGLVAGMILPLLVLSSIAKKRRGQMQRVLPGVLDLMCVSMQAGLSFDGALAKVAEKMKGPLVEEFTRMLQEIRIGVQRKEALKAVGERCNLPDISLLTASLIQADQLGVGIAKVLQVQANNVRQKRRLTIRESAMKAPVKLIFPLVLFIFPTLFIVILGPAVLSLLKAFSK